MEEVILLTFKNMTKSKLLQINTLNIIYLNSRQTDLTSNSTSIEHKPKAQIFFLNSQIRNSVSSFIPQIRQGISPQ